MYGLYFYEKNKHEIVQSIIVVIQIRSNQSKNKNLCKKINASKRNYHAIVLQNKNTNISQKQNRKSVRSEICSSEICSSEICSSQIAVVKCEQ